MTATRYGWTSGVWATYRAWQRHGAQVRRGEHATRVVLWKPIAPRRGNDDSDTDEQRRLFARPFAVFAAEQIDGADRVLTGDRLERDAPERLADADAFFAAVGAQVIEGGDRAYYRPGDDSIHVPGLAQFDHAAHFYATLAPEHIHWTGGPHRLGRDFGHRFGDDAYAAEELVAELGAALWCAQAALSQATRQDHAAYLAGWLRILGGDARALVTVTSKAQAALDYLNDCAGHQPPTVSNVDADAFEVAA
jgi:antirestriction protein ArdC